MHEVTVRNGVRIERHLCEGHATQQGIAVQAPSAITELIKQHVASIAATSPRGLSCPACKATFAEFKQHGVVGCAECYKALESQLAPLIERAHEGGVRHSGKAPRRLVGGGPGLQVEEDGAAAQLAARAQRLAKVRAELGNAVKAEEYERAAKLRDELRKMGDPTQGGA